MKRKIALIRDQVSVFPDPDGVKGGEQDEYAGEVARYLGQIGYQVDIFIHKDHQEMLEIDEWADNVRIIHVPGGGVDLKNAHRENLPDAMQEFTGYLLGFCNRQDKTYDLIHADSWASGWVAAEIKAALGTPFVLTFPGRQHEWTTPKKDHTLFAERQLEAEDRILRDVDAIVTGSSNGYFPYCPCPTKLPGTAFLSTGRAGLVVFFRRRFSSASSWFLLGAPPPFSI